VQGPVFIYIGGEDGGMFVFTRKLTRKSLSLIILVLGMLLCGLIVLISGLGGEDGPRYGKAETEEDRIAFIGSFGWKIDEESGEAEEVTIPRDFDEVYMHYNLIQKAQGLDLQDYRGCKVTRYTYRITNYPTGEEGVLINLLIYDGKVIGGDVMSPRLDGFMHGFEYLGER
jgi:hypothetical protein